LPAKALYVLPPSLRAFAALLSKIELFHNA